MGFQFNSDKEIIKATKPRIVGEQEVTIRSGSGSNEKEIFRAQIDGETDLPRIGINRTGKRVERIEVNPGGGGAGYTLQPNVTLSAPTGEEPAQALASAVINNGQVVAIIVDEAGNGYTAAPIVTITGGNGTGATATAFLDTVDYELDVNGAIRTSTSIISDTARILNLDIDNFVTADANFRAPNLKTFANSSGQSFVPNVVLQENSYRWAGNNIYQALNTGQTGATEPTHNDGIALNGEVQFKHIGFRVEDENQPFYLESGDAGVFPRSITPLLGDRSDKIATTEYVLNLATNDVGGRIYVSQQIGSDQNDGRSAVAPVRTIKKACQLAWQTPGVKETIIVAGGDYVEDNPISIPPDASVVGDNLRLVIIRPNNPRKHIFKFGDKNYVIGVTYRDKVDSNNDPVSTWDFAMVFDDKQRITYDASSGGDFEPYFPVGHQIFGPDESRVTFQNNEGLSQLVAGQSVRGVNTGATGTLLVVNFTTTVGNDAYVTGTFDLQVNSGTFNAGETFQYDIQTGTDGNGDPVFTTYNLASTDIRSIRAEGEVVFEDKAENDSGLPIVRIDFTQQGTFSGGFQDPGSTEDLGGIVFYTNALVGRQNTHDFKEGQEILIEGLPNASPDLSYLNGRQRIYKVIEDADGRARRFVIPKKVTDPSVVALDNFNPGQFALVKKESKSVTLSLLNSPNTFNLATPIARRYQDACLQIRNNIEFIKDEVVLRVLDEFAKKYFAVFNIGTTNVTNDTFSVYLGGTSFEHTYVSGGTVTFNGTTYTVTGFNYSNNVTGFATITVNATIVGIAEKDIVKIEDILVECEQGQKVYPSFNIPISDEKCRRDVGHIVNAVLRDLEFGSNYHTIEAAKRYLDGTSSYIDYVDYEIIQTVRAIEYARELCIFAMRKWRTGTGLPGQPIYTPQYSSVERYFDPTVIDDPVTGCANVASAIDTLFYLFVDVLANDASGTYLDAAYLIARNRDFIADEALELTKAQYPTLQFGTVDPQANRYQDGVNLIEANRSEIIDRSVAQIAVFHPDFYIPGDDQTDSGSRYADAYRLIQQNRSEIIGTAWTNMVTQYPAVASTETKCKRDIGYMIDAVSLDLFTQGNQYTRKFIGLYFDDTTTQIDNGLEGEETESIYAFNQARDQMKAAMTNQLSIKDLTVTADPLTGSNTNTGSCADVQAATDTLTEIITDALLAGNLNALPAENTGVAGTGETKCKRDLGYLIDAVKADLAIGGNASTINFIEQYFDQNGDPISNGLVGETAESVTAFNKARDMMKLAVTNSLYEKDLTISAGPPVYGTADEAVIVGDSGNISSCVDVQSAIDTLVEIATDAVSDGNLNSLPTENTGDFVVTELDNTVGEQKCRRDINYIITYMLRDLVLGGNAGSVTAAEAYYTGAQLTGVPEAQRPATAYAFDRVKELSILAMRNWLTNGGAGAQYTAVHTPIPQFTDNTILTDPAGTPYCANVESSITTLMDLIGDILEGTTAPGATTKDFGTLYDTSNLYSYPDNYITDANGQLVTIRSDYDDYPIIEASPYTQNSSVISFLGGGGAEVDGAKVKQPNCPFPGLELDGSASFPNQGKSMVAAAFTIVSFGGTGYKIVNDGYTQLVSVFVIFCEDGVLAESGGYASITNSATNFGTFALRAIGFRDEAYEFDVATISNSSSTPTGRTIFTIDGLGREPLEHYIVKIDGHENVNSEIEYFIDSVAAVTVGPPFSAQITIDSGTGGPAEFKNTLSGQAVSNASLVGETIRLHRPSIVNSSSHTWEFAGSGTDYNALPENGGTKVESNEQVSELYGRVYVSGTDELGDFKVGTFAKIENRTGAITFTGTVTISEVEFLKLKGGDVVVTGFDASNTLGGANSSNSKIPTQKAVKDYITNNLGPYINKPYSTNAVPRALVELTDSGKISADQIPALRPFNVFTVADEDERLAIEGALAGDIAIQQDEGSSYILNNDLGSLFLGFNPSSTLSFTIGDIFTGRNPNGTVGPLATNLDANSQQVTLTTTTGIAAGWVVSQGAGDTGELTTDGSQITVQSVNSSTEITLSAVPATSGAANLTFTDNTTRGQIQATEYRKGVLYQINITDPGEGYTSPPVITISGGNPGLGAVEARAFCTIANGQVVTIEIYEYNNYIGGQGYTEPPTITFDAPTGTGRTATAVGLIESRLYGDIVNQIKIEDTEVILSSDIPAETVSINRVVNTSASDDLNWVSLSSDTISANQIVEGVIETARLANNSDAANSNTFLRGDQAYAPVVQSLKGAETRYFAALNTQCSSGSSQMIFTTNSDVLLGHEVVDSVTGIQPNTNITGVVTTGGLTTISLNNPVVASIPAGTVIEFERGASPLKFESTYTVGNFIDSIIIANGGLGFTSGQYYNVPLTGGTGTGLRVNIVVTNQVVTDVAISNGGGGYTGDFTVTTSPAEIGSGSQLVLQAKVSTVNKQYANVAVDLDRVTDATISSDLYGTIGVARFFKSQFNIGSAGNGSIQLKTGADSGLDADLLDGAQGAYYLNASNMNAGTVNPDRMSGTYDISISGQSGSTIRMITGTGNPNDNSLPNTFSEGIIAQTRYNTADGLSDGGARHLSLTIRNGGSSFDSTYGGIRQLAFTDNDNMWIRGSGTNVTAWGSWAKVWTSLNDYSAGGEQGPNSFRLANKQGEWYQNALNINYGTLSDNRLPTYQDEKAFQDAIEVRETTGLPRFNVYISGIILNATPFLPGLVVNLYNANSQGVGTILITNLTTFNDSDNFNDYTILTGTLTTGSFDGEQGKALTIGTASNRVNFQDYTRDVSGTFQVSRLESDNGVAKLYMGRTDGTASSPAIYFRSSQVAATTYNSAIVATGGNASNGSGTLDAQVVDSNGFTVNGGTVWNSGNTVFNTTNVASTFNAQGEFILRSAVVRDASGNFEAGTITASLTGAASLNVLKAGDVMTGTLELTGSGSNLIVSGTTGLTGNVTMTNDLNVDSGTLYVDSADNRVGLGTTDPQAQLHSYASVGNGDIWTAARFETLRGDFTAVPGGIQLMFKNQDGNNNTNEAYLKVVSVNDTDYGDNDEANSNFIFRMTDGGTANDRVIFTGDGRVGIKTMNPTSNLSVNGSMNATTIVADTSLTIQDAADNTGAPIYFRGSSGFRNFRIGNQLTADDVFEITPSDSNGATDWQSVPAMSIKGSTKQVAINTSSFQGNDPEDNTLRTYQLNIQGDVNFNGQLFQNNAEFVTSRWTEAANELDIYRASKVWINPDPTASGFTGNPTYSLQVSGSLGVDGTSFTDGTNTLVYYANGDKQYLDSYGVFKSNRNSVSENVTVPAGTNAMSSGPITINSGTTVTIDSGAAWSVV